MALWTPADLSGQISAWFDASDAATVTESGGVVSELSDKGPTGADAFPHSGFTGPDLLSSALNSRDVLDFDNGSSLMDFVRAVDVQDIAVFTVARQVASGSNAQFYSGNKSTTASLDRFYITSGGFRIGNSAGIQKSYTLGDWEVHTAHSSSGTQQLWIDGTIIGTTSDSTVQTYGTNYIGGSHLGSGADFSAAVEIAEMVWIAASELTAGDRELIEGYLAHKWGLDGNLDAGHPYKSSAPTKLTEARSQMPGLPSAPAALVSNPVAALSQMPGILGEPAATAGVRQNVRADMPGLLGVARIRMLNDFTSLLVDAPTQYILQVSTDPATEIPISSWQATLQTDRQSYLQAVIPGYDQFASVLAPLVGSGAFTILRRATIGSATVEAVMASAPLSRADDQLGEINHTATISGYTSEFLEAEGGGSRMLQGIRTRSQTGSSIRVRCEIDWFLRPGDTVIAGDVTFTADFIQYFVTRNGQAYMDVGTRGQG